MTESPLIVALLLGQLFMLMVSAIGLTVLAGSLFWAFRRAFPVLEVELATKRALLLKQEQRIEAIEKARLEAIEALKKAEEEKTPDRIVLPTGEEVDPNDYELDFGARNEHFQRVRKIL